MASQQKGVRQDTAYSAVVASGGMKGAMHLHYSRLLDTELRTLKTKNELAKGQSIYTHVYSLPMNISHLCVVFPLPRLEVHIICIYVCVCLVLLLQRI